MGCPWILLGAYGTPQLPARSAPATATATVPFGALFAACMEPTSDLIGASYRAICSLH